MSPDPRGRDFRFVGNRKDSSTFAVLPANWPSADIFLLDFDTVSKRQKSFSSFN
jgi:hypothetical protein